MEICISVWLFAVLVGMSAGFVTSIVIAVIDLINRG